MAGVRGQERRRRVSSKRRERVLPLVPNHGVDAPVLYTVHTYSTVHDADACMCSLSASYEFDIMFTVKGVLQTFTGARSIHKNR